MTSYWILGFRNGDEEQVLFPMTEPIDGADDALLEAARLIKGQSELDSVVVIVAGIEDPPSSLWIRRDDDGYSFEANDDDVEMRRAVAHMDAHIFKRNGH